MIRLQPRPPVDAREAEALAARCFGVRGTASPLAGERDRNFLLDGEDGRRWVLKVSSPGEDDAFLDFETALLDALAARDGLPVPGLARAPDGAGLARVSRGEGPALRLRLLEHLPGTLLAEARPRAPALLEEVGTVAGRLSRALAEHPDAPPPRPGFDWALARAGDVMERGREAVTDPRRRAVLDRVLRSFRAVEGALAGLPRQLVHGDLNDHNLLVGPPDPHGARTVTGILDLGDAHEACAAAELAVAAAYAVLETPDPLQALGRVVAGYHRERPLEEEELALVPTLVRARLGASVAIAAWRRRGDPEPDPYLLVSEAPAWSVLEILDAVPEALARGVVRGACGREPCPRRRAVEGWLAGASPAPVVALPHDPDAVTVLDLSVGSSLLTGRDTDDTDAFTRRVFGQMAREGAGVGVGRWGEPRAFYLTEAFRGRASELPERRTVHLGVDLFVAAGTEVRAPLPARVHAVRDNADRLDYGPTVVLEHDAPDGPVWTLYGHLERASVAELAPGRTLEAGEPFARVGPAPENGDWPPHLHLQLVLDPMGHEGTFPGVAAPREREAWLSFSPDPTPLTGLEVDARFRPPQALEERRARLLGPNLSVAYRTPIHVVRGRGAELFDLWGRAYLDGVNNVAHVGHEHPRVVEAARRQMAVLNTNTRYLHDAVLRYAERLVALFPEPLSVCWFVNSGSEANELALRLARAHTGARGVVALEGGYHGHTRALVDVSHYKHAGPGGEGPPPWVRVAPMPDDYRGPWRRDDPERAARYAERVAEAARALAATEHGAGAFLHESLLSCGGQIVLPDGYLARTYRAAREAGAVCIADEIQVGLGRVGSHMWGFETQGVVPDIVTLGKPIGNGHPLGAVVTTRAVADSFDNGMEFFSTFGGNPVSAEVGLAVLDVVVDEGLREHAAAVGRELLAGFRELADRHPIVGDVRGMGLFLGLELVEDREARTPSAAAARYVVERARERGILLSTDGPDHDVIKVKPPLPFSSEDGRRLVATLDELLGEDFVRGCVRG